MTDKINDKNPKRRAAAGSPAEDYWEKTFDAIPDAICILDDQFRIVKTNKAMADRLSLSPEQCSGQTCYTAVHRSERPSDTCPHKQTLNDGLSHSIEIYEENLGGYFLVSTSPLIDTSGKVIGSVHVARDITGRRKAEEEKEKLIEELQHALARVKTLSGLLPICASCKKIRDDKGYWNQIEGYIREHSDAEFTHGICPECVKKLYPKLSGK